MTSSRSRPLSHSSSSVNTVTHYRHEHGIRVMSVRQKHPLGAERSGGLRRGRISVPQLSRAPAPLLRRDFEKDRHICAAQLDDVEEGLRLPGVTDRGCIVDPVVRHSCRTDADASRDRAYQNSDGEAPGHKICGPHLHPFLLSAKDRFPATLHKGLSIELAENVDQAGDDPGPTRLMAGADPGAVVAMEYS